MLHLPENIKLIRLLLKKTQPQFGKMLDATKSMIISYEKGRATPDELFIARLSKMAGINENDLKNKKLKEEDFKFYKVQKVLKGQIVSADFAGFRPPNDSLNEERAMLQVLLLEVAKVKSKLYGISVEDAIDELEKNTRIALRQILNQVAEA